MYYIATIGYETETETGRIRITKEKVLIESDSAEEATIIANKDASEDSRSSELLGVQKSPISYVITPDTKPNFY